MPERPQTIIDRADRILDAAGALLQRLGYRKVTIEDIARQADIGKGTVYLHWRTKEQLFQALLVRESIDLLVELLAQLRADPAEALPHRFSRSSYLATMRRPLMLALTTGDVEVLGKLRAGSLEGQHRLAVAHYFRFMIDRRLLRGDVPHLEYAMHAVISGFFLCDELDPQGAELDPAAKADALAHTIRHAFEPSGEPDPAVVAAAAAEVRSLYESVLSDYRAWIYKGATP